MVALSPSWVAPPPTRPPIGPLPARPAPPPCAAGLTQQLEAAAAQLQQFGEEQAQLAALQWRFDQLQKVYTATDGLLNQTQATLERVGHELEAAVDANGELFWRASRGRRTSSGTSSGACQAPSTACRCLHRPSHPPPTPHPTRPAPPAASCHVAMSDQAAEWSATRDELAGCRLTAGACAEQQTSLQGALTECQANQFAPGGCSGPDAPGWLAGCRCGSCRRAGQCVLAPPARRAAPPRPPQPVPAPLPRHAPRCAAEFISCQNELITLRASNDSSAAALGECQGRLAEVELSYQECATRTRRLLKLPGGHLGRAAGSA